MVCIYRSTVPSFLRLFFLLQVTTVLVLTLINNKYLHGVYEACLHCKSFFKLWAHLLLWKPLRQVFDFSE